MYPTLHISKHNTAIIVANNPPTLTITSGSARAYRAEYVSLRDRSRMLEAPFLLSTTLVGAGFAFSLAAFIARLAIFDWNPSAAFAFDDGFPPILAAGPVMLLAGVVTLAVVGLVTVGKDVGEKAMTQRHGATTVTLLSLRPHIFSGRATNLLLDAISPEVRDRLIQLDEDDPGVLIATLHRLELSVLKQVRDGKAQTDSENATTVKATRAEPGSLRAALEANDRKAEKAFAELFQGQ